MKPNYKDLAKEYRKKNNTLVNRVFELSCGMQRMQESLDKKNQEIEEWKAKYADLMDRLIALQESIWKGEGK